MVSSKPELYVERFLPNQNVAQTCAPSSDAQPVHVDCLIKSGDLDGVFYDKCEYVASSDNLRTFDADNWDNNGQDNYDPLQYLCWYGPSSSSPDRGSIDTDVTKTGTKGALLGQWLMDAFTKAGFSQSNSSGVLHAGLATAKVLSTINHS